MAAAAPGTRRAQVRRTLVNQALAITGLPRLNPDGLTGSQCLSSYAGLSTYSYAHPRQVEERRATSELKGLIDR